MWGPDLTPFVVPWVNLALLAGIFWRVSRLDVRIARLEAEHERSRTVDHHPA